MFCSFWAPSFFFRGTSLFWWRRLITILRLWPNTTAVIRQGFISHSHLVLHNSDTSFLCLRASVCSSFTLFLLTHTRAHSHTHTPKFLCVYQVSSSFHKTLFFKFLPFFPGRFDCFDCLSCARRRKKKRKKRRESGERWGWERRTDRRAWGESEWSISVCVSVTAAFRHDNLLGVDNRIIDAKKPSSGGELKMEYSLKLPSCQWQHTLTLTLFCRAGLCTANEPK